MQKSFFQTSYDHETQRNTFSLQKSGTNTFKEITVEIIYSKFDIRIRNEKRSFISHFNSFLA